MLAIQPALRVRSSATKPQPTTAARYPAPYNAFPVLLLIAFHWGQLTNSSEEREAVIVPIDKRGNRGSKARPRHATDEQQVRMELTSSWQAQF